MDVLKDSLQQQEVLQADNPTQPQDSQQDLIQHKDSQDNAQVLLELAQLKEDLAQQPQVLEALFNQAAESLEPELAASEAHQLSVEVQI